MFSDLWLILRCQRGDEDAFSALYNQYKTRVFRTALYLVRNESIAEDITQEVFINVFQKIHDLRNPSAFRTWLYRIVVNESSRLFRDKRNLLHDIPIDEVLEYSSTASDPLTDTLNRMEINDLRNGIHNLPDELRLPVLLYYYSELKTNEIASVLGIPRGTVKSRLYTARTKLAAALKPNTTDFQGNMKEAIL